MLGGAQVDPLMGEAGVKLGKYQLIRRLATGGMAEIFLARATAIHGFEKVVVLKRILPQHAQSDDFIRMFLAEARLAATLHHPNIVQVYDIGEEGNTYFFTMEYVAGQDLRRVVRAARKEGKALPLEHILHIILGMAAGLNHAHEKIGLDGRPLGIVHRDVSPSNVLVTYDGSVKIVDFGIAKAATAQGNTIAGTLKGKIPYMSPEQCRGEIVDRRSDIFSIGTLMWELTTGSRLFTGENDFAVINRVAKGEVPPPTSVRSDYPPELEAIVMRALHADRELRYGSALDLQIDLEDFAREARLPVSSARMGRFMRELFPGEVNASAQLFSPDRIDEQPTMPRPVMSRWAAEKTTEVTVPVIDASSVVEPSVELTPSEVHANQQLGTPGPAELSYELGSATDIRMEARGAGRRAVALAVALGATVLLSAAGGVYWFVLAGSERPSPEAEITPAVIVETPAAADPARAVAPVTRPEAEAPPSVVEPAGVDEAAPNSDDDDQAGPLEVEAAEDRAPSASTPANDDDPEVADEPTKRRSKSSGRRAGPKPNRSSGSKPKWDPDSPFPI